MVAAANRAPPRKTFRVHALNHDRAFLPLTLRKSASRVPAARSTRSALFPSCRIRSRAGTVQELPRTATPNRNLCESTLPPFRVALLGTVSLYFYPHSQLLAPTLPHILIPAPQVRQKPVSCVKNPAIGSHISRIPCRANLPTRRMLFRAVHFIL